MVSHLCKSVGTHSEMWLQVLSLSLDGVTGGVQDKIRSEHQTQTHRMMLAMNLWSLVYLSLG